MSDTVYAYLDKNNKLKGLTLSKDEAKSIKNTGGNVVKLKSELVERIKEIPAEKELVQLYDVVMSYDEEDEVITRLHDRQYSIVETIDKYIELIKYLKLPNVLKYQLEEFNFYLGNVTESIANTEGEDNSFVFDMNGIITDIIAEIRQGG